MLCALLGLAACGPRAEVVHGDAASGLVYARVEAGEIDLARARLADGAVQPLWTSPGRDETWPCWSDAARRLVFQVGAANGRDHADLWSWHPPDAEPAALATTPRRDEAWPAWSPSAATLAFAYRGGIRPAGVALFAFGDAAPAVVPIAEATDRAWFLRPRFAPDGASLVAQRRDGRASQLVLMARGTPPHALTQAPEWFHLKAAFTRDGARVVFARRPIGGGADDVASIDLSGADLRLHASAPESDDQSPAPSPVRDEIALVSDRGGDFDVYLVPIAGGEPRQLTRTPQWDEAAPRWSPSGELLALTLEPRAETGRSLRGHERLARSRVRVVDREGNVRFEAPGFMPDWMPAW